jgi:osmoprotectant transport system permease protein
MDWAWASDHLGAVAGRTLQHLELAGIAVGLGFAISFALALAAIRYRVVYPPLVAVAGILYSIPSLAVFAAFVAITGINLLTAEIPLVMYTLVILIRNIVAGFDGVAPDVLEAASGLGYTRSGRLRDVELPLAVPLIVAGLRLASVSTIGLVTITSTMGDSFGGLGFFIREGISRFFPTEILVGAIPSIAVALLADIAFVGLQRRLTPWARTRARAGQAGEGAA